MLMYQAGHRATTSARRRRHPVGHIRRDPGAPRVYFGLVLLMQVATVLLCAVIGLVVVAIAYGSDFRNPGRTSHRRRRGRFVLVSSAASRICAGILAYPLNQQAVGRRPGSARPGG